MRLCIINSNSTRQVLSPQLLHIWFIILAIPTTDDAASTPCSVVPLARPVTTTGPAPSPCPSGTTRSTGAYLPYPLGEQGKGYTNLQLLTFKLLLQTLDPTDHLHSTCFGQKNAFFWPALLTGSVCLLSHSSRPPRPPR